MLTAPVFEDMSFQQLAWTLVGFKQPHSSRGTAFLVFSGFLLFTWLLRRWRKLFNSYFGEGWSSVRGTFGFSRPEVWFRETKENLRLVAALPLEYWPSPWALNPMGGHVQSFLFATFCGPRRWRAMKRLRQRRVVVSSSIDSGSFALDWWEAGLSADAPILFVMPGVVGKSNNIYIRRIAAHAAEHLGARTVAKAWRGLGMTLTTRRPETWDEVAILDTMDAIRAVRREVGPDVPIIGVGYSYGGSVLTTIAGRFDRSKHTLAGIVSVSGLFDWAVMMRHIRASASFYDWINARVTLMNYKRFGVFDALAAGVVAGAAAGRGAAGTAGAVGAAAGAAMVGLAAGGGAAAAAAVAATKAPAGKGGQSVPTVAQQTAPASENDEDDDDDDDAVAMAPASEPPPQSPRTGKRPASLSSAPAPATRALTVMPQPQPLLRSPPPAPESWRPPSHEQVLAIKNHTSFHEALTIPFSGDADVDTYNARLQALQLSAIAGVDVPVLALLARDDPVCPPLAWERALAAAAANPAFVVVVTDRGGHCGFFEGVFGDSWLDRIIEQFSRALLERPGAPSSSEGSLSSPS